MRASMREAYERDEANARRLEKKLKGRKGPDDGLDSLFEGLPGIDFLEEEYGEDDEEAEGSEDDEESEDESEDESDESDERGERQRRRFGRR